MGKFVNITSETLKKDEKFGEYIRRSTLNPAKKGGTFVGNYDVAPDEFRQYGIVLPKGGMIIVGIEPTEMKKIIFTTFYEKTRMKVIEKETVSWTKEEGNKKNKLFSGDGGLTWGQCPKEAEERLALFFRQRPGIEKLRPVGSGRLPGQGKFRSHEGTGRAFLIMEREDGSTVNVTVPYDLCNTYPLSIPAGVKKYNRREDRNVPVE